jgi:Tn7-like transposition protein D
MSEEARLSLIQTGGASVFLKLGMAAFVLASDAEHLNVCPECQAEHIDVVGAPTWLRAHQLPGSLVCHRHGAPLVRIPLRGRGRHEFVLPALVARKPADNDWSDRHRDVLLDVAVRQATLLSADPEARPIGEWKTFYRDLLASRGLMRSASKVDHARLAEAVQRALGAAIALLPPPCRQIGEGGWPSLLVREHRKAMHPLFHVLLRIVVERTDVPAAKRELRASPSRRLPVVAPRASRCRERRVDWSEVDRESQARLRHAHRLLVAQEPPRRVTFNLLERTAFTNGWLRKREHVLPRSFALAVSLAENDSAFLDRRLAYWAGRMEGAPSWQVCRAAGIRHQRWRDAELRLSAIVQRSRLAA